MEQKPTVSRIVHVKAADGKHCLAAMITAVMEDGSVSLTIFNPNGSFSVKHETTEWHWPERV